MIHEEGYTVSWHEIPFQSFGLSSRRERLLLFASRDSRPGLSKELLPAWPIPTHGPHNSPLLPYRTVADELQSIPLGVTHHNLPKDWQDLKATKATWSPDGLCPTFTCNVYLTGYHYSGKRLFTGRELARLHTFPDEYEFVGRNAEIHRQIGNAVPPGEH
jgi:DNA (cytosine-5)-methyltransferase 1